MWILANSSTYFERRRRGAGWGGSVLGVDFPWVSVITLGGWFPPHLWKRWVMCFISSSSFSPFLLLKREGETFLEVLPTLPNTLEDLKCLLSVGLPMGRFFERVLRHSPGQTQEGHREHCSEAGLLPASGTRRACHHLLPCR